MIGAGVFIIILSVLIVSHEFGHFIAAKRAGIKVDKFAIGFGPAIIKFNAKGTLFLVCVIPFGGYVKLAGDSREDREGKDYEFLSKPVGVRARVVFLGPVFNYILAVIVFSIAFMAGISYIDTYVGSVMEGSPAQAEGIKEGDKVLKVNNKKTEDWSDIVRGVSMSQGPVELVVSREGKEKIFNVIPEEKDLEEGGSQRIIGIRSSDKIKTAKHNPFTAFYKGVNHTFKITNLIFHGLAATVSGEIPVKEAVSGPIGIYYITSEMAKIGFTAVLMLIGSLSVSLAIINLVPLPVLDGGHILFLLIEKIRGRPLKEKTEKIVINFGFAVIGILIVLVIINDVSRYILK